MNKKAKYSAVSKRNEKNFVAVITDFDEKLIKSALNLNNDLTVKNNDFAHTIDWFPNRLIILLNFYNKTNDELALLSGYSKGNIHYKYTKKTKALPKFLEKMSFIFEIPVNFFTDNEIKIKITEQLKIELC